MGATGRQLAAGNGFIARKLYVTCGAKIKTDYLIQLSSQLAVLPRFTSECGEGRGEGVWQEVQWSQLTTDHVTYVGQGGALSSRGTLATRGSAGCLLCGSSHTARQLSFRESRIAHVVNTLCLPV
jgi:hypothetical protein